jgi:hypothetical protein
MSTQGNPAPHAPGTQAGQTMPDMPGPPRVDMMASAEMQAWIARLEAENRSVGKRNKVLAVALAAGIVLLVVVLMAVHRATIGSYAVLEDVSVTRHPASQGRLEISFRVAGPGKVHYRRTSGKIETDLIDYFRRTGPIDRSWSWVYEPGKQIDVTIWHRRGLFRQTFRERFPTSNKADIVTLIDTTGSMSPSIAELKEKCLVFSEQLRKQALEHRFALIGFGDAAEGDWIDKRDFTNDATDFQTWVSQIDRFDGGDLPESALDALEEALTLPLDPEAMRRFYLVTDAQFHEPSRSGADAADLAARLEEERVLLNVFSRAQFEKDYQTLIPGTGRFQEIQNFGSVLSEGRVLED